MAAIDRPKVQFRKPGKDESLYPNRLTSEVIISSSNDRSLPEETDSVTNFVYNRYNNLPIQNQQQKLPIFQYKQNILYLLEKYQTLILVADTGSGKSTQVPQYLSSIGHTVCVTQPRVVAAVSLARRVSQERESLSRDGTATDVGYAVSLDTQRHEGTRILYMTEGVLLREMLADPLLTQYSCLMLDEVHERSLNTDLLMGLVRKILRKRKNLKLVVSSASMDAEHLRAFFDLSRADSSDVECSATVMHAKGRAFPVELFYLSEPAPDYVRATVDSVVKIHENEPFGDILAFLTSQEEVEEAVADLREYARVNNERNATRTHFASRVKASDLLVLPMYGSLPHHRQLEVFKMAGANVRKVVIATNIAETSVTIPGVTYVIDSGYHKILYMEPKTSVCRLTKCHISKSNALQRAGRAGRTGNGKCFRLYTEEAHANMSEHVPPEIQRSDLSAAILQLKSLGIDNILKFPFPTRPPTGLVVSALERLFALQAIDGEGNLSGELGVKMSGLPLTPLLARALCISGDFGVLEEILSIVSLLQVESVFAKPHSGKESIKAKIAKRNNFAVAEGDLITYLNVYQAYLKVWNEEMDPKKSIRRCGEWCRSHYVHSQSMQKVMEIRSSLEKIVKRKLNIENKTFEGPDLGSGRLSRVLRCLCAAMFVNCCYLHADGTYHTVKGDQSVSISESSILYDAPQQKYLVFHGVQCSGGAIYIRDVTPIQKEWLMELASHYYTQI